MSELKPCPFCGGEALLLQSFRSGVANRKMYWVHCKQCHVSQEHNRLNGGYNTRAKAIKAWNRRVE